MRVLVAYNTSSTFNASTLDYLTALQKYSDFEVSYVNVTHGAILNFDINEYDVLFQNYCARLCYDGLVSQNYQDAVLRFRGLKVISIQDEYDHVAKTQQAIRRLGFHVVITVIPKEAWPLVYPKSELPGVKLVQALTGYVPEDLARASRPLSARANWMAYRGNDIGARYGRLGFEKAEIGRRMKALCEQRGIPHDIAVDAASRIYGEGWINFLGNTRTMLGTESGSNAVDFNGEIDKHIAEFTIQNERQPNYSDIEAFLAPFEKPFNIGQISPRVFECAAMRTPMVLFRGNYSGAIQAGVHYIPLEKDYSNADEVFSKLTDLDYLQGFADRAYDHLVKSGNYTYKSFAKMVEAAIEEQYPLVIDPAAIECRKQGATIFSPPSRPVKIENEEQACILALSEPATAQPSALSDFQRRQINLQNLRADIPVRFREIFGLLVKAALLTAKKIWRALIPRAIRQVIYDVRHQNG